MRVRNPAGSGRVLFVEKVVLLSTSSRGVLGVRWGFGKVDLTTTVTVQARGDPTNISLGRASSQNTSLTGDPNPLTLFNRKVEANVPWTWDQEVQLRPNSAFEIVFTDALNVTTDVFMCDVDWEERPDRDIWR